MPTSLPLDPTTQAILWTVGAVAALIPIALLLRGAGGDLGALKRNRVNGERRLLARADVRRYVLYSVVMLLDLLIGVAVLLQWRVGIFVGPVLIATVYLIAAEAWFYLFDQGRLIRRRLRRDAGVALEDTARVGGQRWYDPKPPEPTP